MVNVAVLGYGTVGSGVVEIINRNNSVLKERIGEDIQVKYVLDLRKFPDDPVSKVLVHDFDTILNDKEVSIVVETMGGVNPAYDFTKKALEAGKSVCTSNKELVASHGYELMKLAEEKNINYMFEASCGGGIPIIRPLYTSLTAEVVEEITGIMNGTTNYILSKMDAEGADFAEVLKEAQDKGYAEKNPEADIEGYDPCRKISILSSIAYGKQMDYRDVYTEGITKITADDFKYAKKLGARIKLFGTSTNSEDGISAMVAPYMIDVTNPLYSVVDVFNAIFVKGNMLGDSMYYGSGAGKLPTASAVVGDVVDMARHPKETVNKAWSDEKIELIPMEKVKNSFFVRVKGSVENEGKTVSELFGTDSFIKVDELKDEFAFITDVMPEGEFEEKLNKLPNVIGRIRARL